MKRNFDVVVTDYDKRPRVRQVFKYDEDGLMVIENGQPQHSHFEKMTLRLYALDALATKHQNETISIPDAVKRAALHDKICFSTDGVVDITTEEATMILACLEKQGRDAIVLARMHKMLNDDPPKE